MPTTGQRIKARRMNAQFAASVGAKACGVTTQQYYNYENSKTLPRIEQLVNLAERYRCDVEHLKGDDWKGEEPVEESTKEEETLKKEPETATLEEAAEKIDQLKEHIRHLNDIIRDHEKETDKLKEELSEAKERRALPIDYSKVIFAQGLICYNTNNGCYCVVINGSKGTENDRASLVMELWGKEGYILHTPPNRALIPTGRTENLEYLAKALQQYVVIGN